jgi:hypothetical protein
MHANNRNRCAKFNIPFLLKKYKLLMHMINWMATVVKCTWQKTASQLGLTICYMLQIRLHTPIDVKSVLEEGQNTKGI